MGVVVFRAPAPLKVNGVSRDAESPGGKSVLVHFTRALTDGELRFFHEVCARSAPLMDGQDD